MDLRVSTATCLIFVLIGFLSAPGFDSIEQTTDVALPRANEHLDKFSSQSLLDRQQKAHSTFQSNIDGLQTPRSCESTLRLLTVKEGISSVGSNHYEEFARAFHFLSLSLQVAMATGRALSLHDEWTLLPGIQGDCSSWRVNHWTDQPMNLKSMACLREEVTSNCTPLSIDDTSNIGIRSTFKVNPQQEGSNLYSTLAFGIIPGTPITKENSLFHADYYGKEPVIEMPSWPYPKDTYLIDVVPAWERLFGRFWVRSQMVHFLWNKWQGERKASLSEYKGPAPRRTTVPYIAFYWTSCKRLRKNLAVKFGRNATVSQDFSRYMGLATQIRNEHDPTLKTIYILTDGETANDGVPIPNQERLNRQYSDWKFLVEPISSKENVTSDNLDARTQQRMLAGLEVMRKADYLVGSFQSQMFRLAAELNAAWFCSHYPVSTRRHWTVDVEWFENP